MKKLISLGAAVFFAVAASFAAVSGATAGPCDVVCGGGGDAKCCYDNGTTYYHKHTIIIQGQ